MSHKSKISLVEQVKSKFDSMLAIGTSKHTDKISSDTNDKIYSWSTYRTYLKHACYFAKWCKSNYSITHLLGHRVRDLDECKDFIVDWIQNETDRGLSPYTLHLEAAAVCKLYSLSVDDLSINLPPRKRENITRSRGTAVRDRNFSESRNKELIIFCKCTGLRRSELEAIRGDSLVKKDGKYYLYIYINTKGGRPRYSPIVGTDDETNLVVDKMESAGNEKVWGKVNSNADIHSYRSEYATKIYKLAERDFSDIKNERMIIYKNRIVKTYFTLDGKPNYLDNKGFYDFSKKDKYGNPVLKPGFNDKSSLYICRKDLKRKSYDRLALFAASKALGHNRETVVAEYYIR